LQPLLPHPSPDSPDNLLVHLLCPASRLIALCCCVAVVALLCLAARRAVLCARTNKKDMPVLSCLASTPAAMPRSACHLLPPSHTAQSLPESPSAEPSSLLPQTTHATWSVPVSAPSSRLLCTCLRRAASASLPVSLCVFAPPTHQTTIPSIHITIHRPRPTIRHTRTILDASMRLSHRRP